MREISGTPDNTNSRGDKPVRKNVIPHGMDLRGEYSPGTFMSAETPRPLEKKVNSIAARSEVPEQGLPGGSMQGRPVEIGGKLYDPLDRPGEFRDSGTGEVSYHGGKELDKRAVDAEYSRRFFDKLGPDAEIVEERMRQQLTTAVPDGTLSIPGKFGEEKGFSDIHRETLSTYRVLADDLGYTVEGFRKTPDGSAVTAKIKPKETPSDPTDTDPSQSENKNPFTGDEITTLKGIHEKCTTRDPDNIKYPMPLFDKTVTLTDDETDLVGKLVGEAQKIHGEFVAQEPEWSSFQTLLAARRNIHGTFGEGSQIVEDSQATAPYEEATPDRGAIIRVPSNIFNLYTWKNRIDDCGRTLEGYKKGQQEGAMAKNFGEGVKQVYTFVKKSNEQRV